MIRNIQAGVAALVLATAAGIAQADVASGGSITVDLTAPDAGVVGGTIAVVDGSFFLTAASTTGGDYLVYDATFSSTHHAPRFELVTGLVTGAYLASVTFTDGVNSAITLGGLTNVTGALASNTTNVFTFDLNGAGAYGLTQVGTYSGYNVISLTFNFDNVGDSLQLDAFSNPEPGTWALFGLGAAGLAGWSRRRRKARAARKSAQS
ncbi:MAG: PEP-CTERM sorting domain-containing protein [Planctomycetes bacterium]|nr:PEP-CTERM sorting domain-containing protein [Planctomycetota bacterium]